MEVLVVEVMEGVERIERRREKRRVWTSVSQGSCMKLGLMSGLEGSVDDCRQTTSVFFSKYFREGRAVEGDKLTCTLPVDKGSVTQQLPPKTPNVKAPTATFFSKNNPALTLNNSSCACTSIAPLLASDSMRA